MARIAYLDCYSGISGDMFLGALVDARVPLDYLREQLARLPVGGYRLEEERVQRGAIAAQRVRVVLEDAARHGDHDHHGHDHHDGHDHHGHHHHHPRRNLADIEAILDGADLPAGVVDRARDAFRRLAQAEARVHGTTVDQIHFHEVGAVDAVVDVVGTALGLHYLGVERLVVSPLPLGHGEARSEHGRIPVPGPATLELLRGVPVWDPGIRFELVTPTGAALVTSLAESFGPLPPMVPERTGYGAGERDLERPNVVRLIVGEAVAPGPAPTAAWPAVEAPLPVGREYVLGGEVIQLDANLDDLNPQLVPHLIEAVLAAGALDAIVAPVIMKKGRPGYALSVLTLESEVERVARTIFRESTTIGLRLSRRERITLRRGLEWVRTPWGLARVKVAEGPGGEVLNAMPEFEDARRLAEAARVPLKRVLAAVQTAFEAKLAARGGRVSSLYPRDEKDTPAPRHSEPSDDAPPEEPPR